MSSVAQSEQGFTLIELIVALALSVLILGALTGAFIVFLQNSDAATQRLSESHDEQITSAYFATDVQTAETITTSTLNAAFAPTCTVDTAGTPFITFSSPNAGTTVTYAFQTVGLERQLVRTAGSSNFILAHNMKSCTGLPGSTADPAFSAPTKITNCFSGGGSCTGKYVAMSFLDVTVKDPTGFTYTVRGNRRVS